MTRQPLVGQGLHIIEASRSHSDTHTHTHSVVLLWTIDHPNAETSTGQHKTLTRDWLSWQQRDSNPQSQQASGHRPTSQTARPLESAQNVISSLLCKCRVLYKTLSTVNVGTGYCGRVQTRRERQRLL